MITIKSNIEALINIKTKYVLDRQASTNIEYAIETLKMIDQLKDDAWDESRIENIGRNGATGSHYE